MSTDFIADRHIPFSKIREFKYGGVKVEEIDESGCVILTDGDNYMWASPNADFENISFENKYAPEVTSTFHYEGVLFTRYAGNDPTWIIEAMEAFFDVNLISEHSDTFDELITKRQGRLTIAKD